MVTAAGFPRAGGIRSVLGLHPGLVGKEVPTGETPAMAQTFLNYFVKAEGNHPARDFRAPGGPIHPRSSDGVRSQTTC